MACFAVVLDGLNRQSPIASVQRTRPTLASHSAVPRGTNTTPMNAQSRDSNRSATNAGPMRTKSCVLGGDMSSNERRTLAIRIAATTLASDSAMTIVRFRPSKAVVLR